MAAWLDFAPTAFDRQASKNATPALFGRREAVGLEGALFDVSGEPVAEAVALDAGRREDLEAERRELLARLAAIDAMLSA